MSTSARSILIVGSGASGVHFARRCLANGVAVTMLDVGNPRHRPTHPELDFADLKAELPDPVREFLGADYSALELPHDDSAEYYGFPPSKDYVFQSEASADHVGRGFNPLFSHAQGGLAEAWTGGAYTFNAGDLQAFPFEPEDLAPYYDDVAQCIGITGADDDLAQFIPLHEGLLQPLDLDENGANLAATYEQNREKLNRRMGFFMGRSRVAVLSAEMQGRPACDKLGRCLWGCPTDAFYVPSITLQELRRHSNFNYLDGRVVEHFLFDGDGRVKDVVSRSVNDGSRCRHPVSGQLVLAAGALSSARIYLTSLLVGEGQAPELGGLMDNRQVMMPFVNRSLVGKAFDPHTYQYHQLATAWHDPLDSTYVHGQITTLKTALIHPLIQSLPFGMRAAMRRFGDLHGSLGLLNINLSDERSDQNTVSIERNGDGSARLLTSYFASSADASRVKRAIAAASKALRALGCLAPRAMTRVRPMGAGVHYGGLLPMTAEGSEHTVDPHGTSRRFRNLTLADAITFPALPAKNLTFTLMANAVRIADRLTDPS